MARAEIAPIVAERTSHTVTLEEIKSTTANAIQEQSARISVLSNNLDSVSSQLAGQSNVLNSLESAVGQLLKAAATPSQTDVKALSNLVQVVANQLETNLAIVTALRQSVQRDQNSISNLMNSISNLTNAVARATGDMVGVGDQLTVVSNSMARKLDTLGDKLEEEKSLIQTLSSRPRQMGDSPIFLWVLLLANFGVGIGGLAALGLWVRHRKSVGEQVRLEVLGQIPDMMKEFGGQVQPRLDAVTRQCEDLARNLGRATETTKEILQAMNQKHEENQKRWQSRLDGLIAEQPEKGQRRPDSTAQAGASRSAQSEALGVKTESVKDTVEEVFADASARQTQLNRQLGKEFERLKGRDESLSALVWPAFFHGGAALAGWRQRIEEKLFQQDPCAFELFLALGWFSNAVRQPGDLRKVGQALNAVGTDAYRFWKSIGTPSLDAALEWRTGFQGFLDASGIPIDIILALERDRFDPNTMLSVDTGSATRMYVKEALSWIVLDKSGDSPIVRHHARVITC